jgi:hypothetical protein
MNSYLLFKTQLSKEALYKGGAFDVFRFYNGQQLYLMKDSFVNTFCVSNVVPGMRARHKEKSPIINSSPNLEPRSSKEPPRQGSTIVIFRFSNGRQLYLEKIHLRSHFVSRQSSSDPEISTIIALHSSILNQIWN